MAEDSRKKQSPSKDPKAPGKAKRKAPPRTKKAAARPEPPPPPKAPALEPEVVPESRATLPEPITIELDRQMEKLEVVLERVREEVTHWAKKGVYTKVRFKFRDRQLLPDIPVAAFLAAEAATFWWGGLLRALAMNLGGGALFDVQLISDAEPHLARAQEHMLAGDVDEAVDELEKALAIDRDLPLAHLNLGVCFKLRGDKDRARRAFRRATDLDPRGDLGRQAAAQLKKLT